MKEAPLENWRPVVGHELLYEVSDQGRVRSLDRRVSYGATRRGRVLRQTPSQGRATVVICDGTQVTHTVHRLIAEAFLGERPAGLDICHYNGDGMDNRLSNLRYDTRGENIRDAVRHGTYRNGCIGKTHCKSGHPFDSANTYIRPDGNRDCRACRREASAKYHRVTS